MISEPYPADKQQAIRRALVLGHQVMQLLPLALFEGEGLRVSWNVVDPRIQLPSHTTVAKEVSDLDTEHLRKLKP